MKSENILIIAAHPDDEILGTGGTLKKHILKGDKVNVLIFCEAETMRYKGKNVNLEEMAKKAGKIIGFNSIKFLKFPDQHLDTFSLVDIIKPIEEEVEKLKPSTVYTHYYGDINRDHKILAEATIVALRPFKNLVESLIAYETPSSTEWQIPYNFSANYFVDITETFECKLKAMECYKSEIYPPPHPRSLESLKARAEYWGSFSNMRFAEAFFIYKKLWF